MSITNHPRDNSAESTPRDSDQILHSTRIITNGATAPLPHEGGDERAARRSLRSVFGRRQHDKTNKGTFIIENSAVDFNDYIAGYVRFTPAKKTIRRD